MSVQSKAHGLDFAEQDKEGFCWSTSARNKGELVRITQNSALDDTLVLNLVNTSTEIGAHNTATTFAILLEDCDASSWVPVCVRGICDALVEVKTTAISENAYLIPSHSIVLNNDLVLTNAVDMSLDVSAVNGTFYARKVIGMAIGSHATATATLISVIFNGKEGFGIAFGPTDITP